MKPGRVSFTVPGEPKGKARPRAVAKIRATPAGPEAYVQLVTPADTRAEEARVREVFRRKYPDHRAFSGPVLLRFTAVFETPASFTKALRAAAARGELYAIRKPDKDNIEKLIVDALNHVAFVDDQQVMGGGVKRYGSPARVEVSLEPLGAGTPPTPGEKRAEARVQANLPLGPRTPARTNAPKSGSANPKPPPDLTTWSPRQRALIEAAIARDERAMRDRGK